MPKSARQTRRERKERYQRETQLKQQLILKEGQEKKAQQHQLYVKITRASSVKQQQFWPFMCKICKRRCFGSFAVYRRHLNGHKRWLPDNFYQRVCYKNLKKSRNNRISSNLSQSKQSRSTRSRSKQPRCRISSYISPSKPCSCCSSTGAQSKQSCRKSSSTRSQSKRSCRKSSSTGSQSKLSRGKRPSIGAPSKQTKKTHNHGQRLHLPKAGYKVDVRQDGTFDVQFGNVNFKCSHCFGFFPDINVFMKHSLVAQSGAISCVCYRCKESFTDEAALKVHERMHQDSNMPPPSKPVDNMAPVTDLLKCPTPNCGAMFDNVDNFRSHTARCRKNAPYKVQSEYGKDQESWITLERDTMSVHSKPPSTIPPQHQYSSSTNEKTPSSVFKVKLTNVDSSNQGGTSSVPGSRQRLEYSCCSCKGSFSKPDQLIMHHTEVHTESHSCKICGKQFGSVSFLENHMSKEHKMEGQVGNTKQTLLENTECKMEGHSHVSNSKQELLENAEHKVESRLHVSNTKQKVLENTEQRHQAVGVVRKTASGQHRYECIYCPKVFSSMETLQGHVGRRHWLCSECGKVCKSKERLAVHKGEHEAVDAGKEKKNDVEVATKVDNITSEVSQPKEKAHKDENIVVPDAASKTEHKCNNCSKTFADEKMLQIHQVCHASVSVNLYQEAFINELVKNSGNYFPGHPSDCRCRKCRSVAAGSQVSDVKQGSAGGIGDEEDGTKLIALKNHNTYVTPSRRLEGSHKKESNAEQSEGVTKHETGQYPCDQCDKGFSSKRYLAQHRVWHSGRYKCDECGKHCQSANILKLHKRKHTDETYCSCQKCGQGFKHERSLKEHTCRPAGEVGKTEVAGDEVRTVKPTKSTAFAYKPQRTLSVSRKANKTVQQCPDCKECFTDEPQLEIHKICHTTDKQYLCILCVKSFGDLNNLLKHIMEDKEHEKLDSCPICGKQIKTKKCIPEHMLGHYGVQPYPCDQCEKRFSSKIYLRQHRAWHSGRYKCDVCGKHCQSANILKLHQRKHTNESCCTCKKCGQGFKHEKSLKKHICGLPGRVRIKTEFSQIGLEEVVKRETPKSFICRFCGNAYARGDTLRMHERAKHSSAPRKSYSCTQCNKTYLSHVGLRYHIKAAHTEGEKFKPHLCCECGKCFQSNTLLKYHILSLHKKLSRHQCSYCGQRFFHRTVMLTHIKGKHTDDKKHVCAICGKRFVARTELVKHTRSHTQERPYKCSHCGKGFNIDSQRKNHERLHTNELPYECGFCRIRFRTAEILNHHKKVEHDDNNPHVCTFCNKKCATHGSLKVHMNYHIKPFMCTLCGTGFGKKSSVKVHEKSCAGGKLRLGFNKKPKHQCDICNKKFDRPSKLQTHIRIHTGELPYPCSKCSDKFRTDKLRISHQRTSHPELYQFHCTICDGGFTTSVRLSEHMRQHTLPCKCLICGKGFPRESKLKLHMNKHTREKTGGKSHKKKRDPSMQFQETLAAAVMSQQKREKENPEDPADVKKEIHGFDHKSFLIQNILQMGTEVGKIDGSRQASSSQRVIAESLADVKLQPHEGEVTELGKMEDSRRSSSLPRVIAESLVKVKLQPHEGEVTELGKMEDSRRSLSLPRVIAESLVEVKLQPHEGEVTELGKMEDSRRSSSLPRVIAESLVEVKLQPHEGDVTELGKMEDSRRSSSSPRVIAESLVEVKFQPHEGEVKDEHFWAGPTFCNL